MTFFTTCLYISAAVNVVAGNWLIAGVCLAVAVGHHALDVREEHARADEAPVPSPAPSRRR